VHFDDWLFVLPTVHASDVGARSSQRARVRAAQQGDAHARDDLLAELLPLIRRAARTYAGATALETEEFVQEGVVGLLTALERYDPDLGPPFWPYASWWVRRLMQRLVADLTMPMVVSDRAMRQLACVKHARQDHEQAHHCEPSPEEIAESTGYTREQLGSLMSIALAPRSLDERLQAEDGASGTLGDLLTDPRAEESYDAVDQELRADALRHAPNDLCERERNVLRARYGFDGPARTLHEVGDDLDLSAERVRQIQEHALEKLHVALSTGLSESVATPGQASGEPRVGEAPGNAEA
jgi:RNA polymerase sigma factor (sigma-70 family)